MAFIIRKDDNTLEKINLEDSTTPVDLVQLQNNLLKQYTSLENYIKALKLAPTPKILNIEPDQVLSINEKTVQITPFDGYGTPLTTQVQIATDDLFQNIVFDSYEVEYTTTYTHPFNYTDRTYFIRARYKDNLGNYTLWTPYVRFYGEDWYIPNYTISVTPAATTIDTTINITNLNNNTSLYLSVDYKLSTDTSWTSISFANNPITGVGTYTIQIPNLAQETSYDYRIIIKNSDQTKSVISKIYTTTTTSLPVFGDTGIIAGGIRANFVYSDMQSLNIPVSGQTSYFGDMINSISRMSGTSDKNRGVFSGGLTKENLTLDSIQYIIISNPNNSLYFGNLTQAKRNTASTSNGQLAVVSGGQNDNGATKSLDYFNLYIVNNAKHFGDASQNLYVHASTTNITRGVVAGGYNGSNYVQKIEYFTFATPANTQTFGNLTQAKSGIGATSNRSRGIFTGGYYYSWPFGYYYNSIEYIDINTTSNAASFGIMGRQAEYLGTESNGARAVMIGGDKGSNTYYSNIEYVDINTLSNGITWGNLASPRSMMATCSGK
jgi:hypothetical protein